MKKQFSYIFIASFFSLSALPALAQFDVGYEHLPRGVINILGTNLYCRFVGNPIFLSCAREFQNDKDQHFFVSRPGVDLGYNHLSRGFKTLPDGRVGFCRFVGEPPREVCLIATQTGFNQEIDKPINFPITGEKDNSVANGGMRTSFTLNSDGQLTAVTNTRTKVKLAGFTGGVSIILLNADRQPIWASEVHRYGVDGCLVGTCNRNDNWNDSVPPDILRQVRGYSILQQHEPKWLKLAGQKGEQFLRWLNSDEGKATITTIVTIAAML